MNFFGIGFLELLFILVAALLLLGPTRMVQVARTLGKYLRELQRVSAEVPRLLSLDEEQPQAPPPQRQQLPERPSSEPQGPADQNSVPRE